MLTYEGYFIILVTMFLDSSNFMLYKAALIAKTVILILNCCRYEKFWLRP